MQDERRIREEAFRVVYDANYWRVLAYSERRSRNSQEASEATAEVFSIAWRRFDEIPGEAVLPWLYGVARKVLANQRRGRTRWERLLGRVRLLDSGAVPVADLALPDHAADMRVALAKLTDTEREILLMTVWEGLTHAEVAQMLGTTENAVSIRAHRARRKLRAAYEHETGADDVAPDHERGRESE